jgi:hypothetical protein
MSAADSGIADIALADAPVTDSAVVNTPTTDTTTTDETPVIDSSADTEDTGDTEAEETETTNADGSEKTPEEAEAFKTAAAQEAGKADVLPTEARTALKALKELDGGKYSKVVAALHGSYERWTAAKELLGAGEGSGINGLRDFLAENNAKNLPELRTNYGTMREATNAVAQTDELLYAGDGKIWKNVVEDLKASGHPEALGKLTASFLTELKAHDPEAFYSEASKPLVLAGLEEAGFVGALNSAFSALAAGDTEKAKGLLKNIGGWFTNLRDELSETSKISKERQKWNEEKTAGETKAQTEATQKFQNGVAEECETNNNNVLGAALKPFLKMPYFKGFDRSNLIPLGNSIKANLYEALKADKVYQTQVGAMWKQKSPDRAKIVAYHNAKLEAIANRIVTDTVKRSHPKYAVGGSAAGRVANATATKAAAAKAGAQSVATGKPIYIAARPNNLIREDIRLAGGKVITASDLVTLQITGRGYVKSTDGKSVNFVTWRK